MQRLFQHGALLRGALAALLLFAQVAALAHGFEHDATAEPETCATCSIGGGLQTAAASHHEHPVPRVEGHLSWPQTEPAFLTHHQIPGTARAPPAVSSRSV